MHWTLPTCLRSYTDDCFWIVTRGGMRNSAFHPPPTAHLRSYTLNPVPFMTLESHFDTMCSLYLSPSIWRSSDLRSLGLPCIRLPTVRNEVRLLASAAEWVCSESILTHELCVQYTVRKFYKLTGRFDSESG